MDEIAKRTLFLNLIVIAIVSCFLFVIQQPRWLIGFLVGSLWMLLSLSLTINIFRIISLQKFKKALMPILLIKFPILYLFAYIILVSKLFPLTSLFAGTLLTLLTTSTTLLWPRHT